MLGLVDPVDCPTCKPPKAKPPPAPKRRKGRKIHAVEIPQGLRDIGINEDAFRLRVETCCKAKNQKAWQTELNLLSTYVGQYGGGAVLETWVAAVGSGWQGCAPFVRETSMRLAKEKGGFTESALPYFEPDWPADIVDMHRKIESLQAEGKGDCAECTKIGHRAYDRREEFKATGK